MVIATIRKRGVPDRKVSIFASTGEYTVDIDRKMVAFVASVAENGEVILRPLGRSRTVAEDNKLATSEFRQFTRDDTYIPLHDRGK